MLKQSEEQKGAQDDGQFEVEVQGHGPIPSLYNLLSKRELKKVIENLLGT